MSYKAIVLLSGGLDSSLAAAWAKAEGFDLYALNFNYGQRQQVSEENAASRVGAFLGMQEIRWVKTALGDLTQNASSLISGSPREVPKDRSAEDINQGPVPSTFVPARNILFLTYALAWCHTLDCHTVVIGANEVDFSGYPDCRQDFMNAYQLMARLGSTVRDFKVVAPFQFRNKKQIVEFGRNINFPMGLTHTCYDPDPLGRACGQCDACQIRLQAFRDAGVKDPAKYVHG